MKRGKFTDEQILKIVREGEAGRRVADLCRTNGLIDHLIGVHRRDDGSSENNGRPGSSSRLEESSDCRC